MRWETHLHTKEGSACASASAAEMAKTCKEAGYDGMFVTDHFYHGNTCVDRDLPWEEWARQFSLGYYHAKEIGDRIGLRVCFGWEYSWDGNDFLTYGLSPQWLAAHPETVRVTPYEYLKLIREAGGCIVHAHPFRQEWYVKMIKLLPDLVDAVEVYNGGNHEDVYNDRALWYAESFGMKQTSGSDTHWSGVFTGGILTDCEMNSTEDYGGIIRSGGITGLIRAGKDCPF
ncbi:MAG: histidinol-phosphatase [Oscillospiraceae bacterium]|nr:histidinol-phosphatase [Oscillospiraceae bacterium]